MIKLKIDQFGSLFLRLFLKTSLLLIFGTLSLAVSAFDKPRVFVLTDIENEPDDAMSMVRFMVYSNQFDMEGLAATTSVHQQKRVAPERICEIVEDYIKATDDLEKHESEFPTL